MSMFSKVLCLELIIFVDFPVKVQEAGNVDLPISFARH